MTTRDYQENTRSLPQAKLDGLQESDKEYLYHFTKKEFLIDIIKNKKFVLCYNLEDYPFLCTKNIIIEDIPNESLEAERKTTFAYPMVCFYDYPQSDLL